MASGYGIDGGVSRCFTFWQDLLTCYTLNTTQTGGADDAAKWKCVPQRDDYFECLLHGKERAKTKALQEAYVRYELANPGAGKRSGEVKGLGLLGKGK